jgi:hypothetical protein
VAELRTCGCGCGEPIPLANCTRPKDGIFKGQQSSARFLRGHHLRAQGAPWFKGDDAGYNALHTYLRKYFPKAGRCEECGRAAPTDYALIKGREYSRDRNDYRELCRRCHVSYDEIGGSRWRDVITGRQAAGDAPVCSCGCGAIVEWDNKHARWKRFTSGHYSGAARAARRGGGRE